MLFRSIAAVNKASAQNHIEMLATKAYQAKVAEGTRKAQLDWFTALSAGNNAYVRELAQAQADYAAASARLDTANANLAYAQSALANLM